MEKLNNGWLNQARKCPSPNFNQRPSGEISLLVIHCMSLPEGEYHTGNPESLFLNTLDTEGEFSDLAGLKVSAHLFISREGNVTQFVSFNDRAWHAGISCFEGRENCNDFSIGVELEGTDHTPFTEAQYGALSEVVDLLCTQYPAITSNRIVGHCDIAPGRKTDPGSEFEWGRVK